jgi:phage protein U
MKHVREMPIADRQHRANPSDTQSLRTMIEDDYSDADLAEYFAMQQQEASQHGDTKRFGRRVVWIGMDGALIAVDGKYARAIDGNIFDRKKLSSVVNAIETGQRPTLVVGYGDLSLIDANMVKEDQEAFDRGELMSDRPLEESDIGKFLYQIRDGNHRVFGALIAGEKKVWMHLMANRLQDVTEYRLAKRARKLAQFKKKFGERYAKEIALIDEKLRND